MTTPQPVLNYDDFQLFRLLQHLFFYLFDPEWLAFTRMILLLWFYSTVTTSLTFIANLIKTHGHTNQKMCRGHINLWMVQWWLKSKRCPCTQKNPQNGALSRCSFSNFVKLLPSWESSAFIQSHVTFRVNIIQNRLQWDDA